MSGAATLSGRSRETIVIRGTVQGVGFRPFIYRLATGMGLDGWVTNSPQGVVIEAEGSGATIEEFLERITRERPPLSDILSVERSRHDPLGVPGFRIRPSDGGGKPTSPVLPDIAVCPDCLREMLDPSDRRHLYPFINCTNCGPRFSIILSLPYDRPRTTMKDFAMCPECEREYGDPSNRRFHAQPIACPDCGPQLALWDGRGHVTAERHESLIEAARIIMAGGIVAVKGLGGFHLMTMAGDDGAVRRLRRRKRREEKPLALMYPSPDAVKRDCEVSPAEERLLLSPEAPIVLLRRRLPPETGRTGGDAPPIELIKLMESTGQMGSTASTPSGGSLIAPSVAPGNPFLGAMLPYTPLHHLLMREVNAPVVATSGNLSDEPICTDEREALSRLGAIADAFLVHDRPIRRHVDDSVARVIAGRECVIRRARGYAPLPVLLRRGEREESAGRTGRGDADEIGMSGDGGKERRFIAVGAHLKSAIAVASGESVFISQHIGDLETEESFRAFTDTIESFRELYETPEGVMVCDLHPGYLSTQYALGRSRAPVRVQHHHAHVCSCMAEHGLEGTVLGVSWDGTGYGPDGRVWGGEFLLTDGAEFRRIAAFREFPLPGGEKAIEEPGRSALGMLWTLRGDEVFTRNDLLPVRALGDEERDVLRRMLGRRINSPLTTSAGRIFDAVSALLGLRRRSAYEGQAAMDLEFLADREAAGSREGGRGAGSGGHIDGGGPGRGLYPFGLEDMSSHRGPVRRDAGRPDDRSSYAPDMVIDWGPMIEAVVRDIALKVRPSSIALKFHDTMVEIILGIARRSGYDRVVLTGGCFQNRLLAEGAIGRLSSAGFRPYWHRRVPPNDGGIALGQVFCAAARERASSTRGKEGRHVPGDTG